MLARSLQPTWTFCTRLFYQPRLPLHRAIPLQRPGTGVFRKSALASIAIAPRDTTVTAHGTDSDEVQNSSIAIAPRDTTATP